MIRLLIGFAQRFRGLLAFLALILLVGAAGFFWAFSEGSFDPLVSNFARLSPAQFFWVIESSMVFVGVLLVILIAVSFRSSHPQRLPAEDQHITIYVHEKGNVANPIGGVTVQLQIPPESRVGQSKHETGQVIFWFPSLLEGKKYRLIASKVGYKERNKVIALKGGGQAEIWLEREMERQAATETEGSGKEEDLSDEPSDVQMKYYVYISDSKVDMLFSQLSAARQGEFAGEHNRIPRLELVIDFLRQSGDIGSVDTPHEYFQGSLDMRWGPYKGGALVYFGGMTDRTILGLGGSVHHVIGNQGTASTDSQSITPNMISYLRRELGLDEDKTEAMLPWESREHSADIAIAAVHLATTRMQGPEQRLEFIAKRLVAGPSPYPQRDPSDGMQVLLGTPLYVALAE